MENRTQSLPTAWQKQKLDMTSQPKQGPTQTMAPTSRDASPGGTSYTDAMIRSRPAAFYAEQRAQAPIPTEVVDVLLDAPGGYTAQIMAGVGSLATVAQGDGGGGNTSNTTGDIDATGSASKVTGRPVIGQTLGKGTI